MWIWFVSVKCVWCLVDSLSHNILFSPIQPSEKQTDKTVFHHRAPNACVCV